MLLSSRLSLRLAICVGVLLYLVAKPQGLLAHGSSKAPVLGQAPTNCPTTPDPQSFNRWFGMGLGSGPVRAVFGGPGTVIPTESHNPAGLPHTRYGWPEKTLWAMTPGTTDIVTLHGWNLATGKRVLFNFKGVADDNTPLEIKKVGKLDPRFGGTGADGWASFISEEYFPSAGCYVFFAQWRTGSWVVPVAYGR
jgi:hypothetical protein